MARKTKEVTEMAIATEEMTANEFDETPENVTPIEEAPSEKSKRERVDLTTLSNHEKVQFSLSVPAGLKLALTQKAEAEGKQVANVVRDMLAESVNYAIPDEFAKSTRTGKYDGMSDEQIKELRAEQGKTRRTSIKALLEALKANPELAAQISAANGSVDLDALL